MGQNSHYQPKLGYESPHTLAVSRIPDGTGVLDLGCAGGYLSRPLRDKGCRVTGVDMSPIDDPESVALERFVLHNLDGGPLPIRLEKFKWVLMLDLIEHLKYPERFLEQLLREGGLTPHASILVSSGNIGFIITRLMLLFGQFNYAKRGILDLDHSRLFTFGSLRRLFEQSGFDVIDVRGIPAPFPLALGDNWLAHSLLALNRLLIRVWRSLFSYQIFMVVSPRPTLEHLLATAHAGAQERAAASQSASA